VKHLNNMTRYFRQSLLDAERLCPRDQDLLPVLGIKGKENKYPPATEYLPVEREAWLTGRLPEAVVRQLFDGRQAPQDHPRDDADAELDLVLFPRVDMLLSDGGQTSSQGRRVLLPLGVHVRVRRDGALSPGGKPPWIPRPWLSPNDGRGETLGEMHALDEFVTHHPYESVRSWSQLVSYGTRLLAAVVGAAEGAGGEGRETENHPCLYDLVLHDAYRPHPGALLQTAVHATGAGARLIKVLDALLNGQAVPPLYQRYCGVAVAPLEEHRNLEHDPAQAMAHVGQMTGEFPLSPKQRNALHHFLRQEDGEILAVNGPPGTGKTTLLRSVVAQMWTRAALAGDQPPLIVATSNNNQAVTNILQSFARVDEAGLPEALRGRWLPEVDSYGLYLCSGSKAKEDNPYRYYGPNGEGCMGSWLTREFVDRARTHFLECAGIWHGQPLTEVEPALELLRQALSRREEALGRGVELLAGHEALAALVREGYGDTAGLQTACDVATEQRDAAEQACATHALRLDELYALWEQRGFWSRLLHWLPMVRRHEQRRTARLLNSWGEQCEECADEAVESRLQGELRRLRAELRAAQEELEQLCRLRDEFDAARTALEDWMAEHRPERVMADTPAGMVAEISDRVLRFEMFKLAGHYWEARWLLETRACLETGNLDGKSPENKLRKAWLMAMLTPCFVATFYMLPAPFIGWRRQDLPQFDSIDLLIIDEAGQAPPEVAAAAFALAKKALVVGDTDQIQPVWNVPVEVDLGNLRWCDLLTDEADHDRIWLPSGLTAAAGNVMQVAQRQCRYHQFSTLQRGLYLTEHRRCYDRIVQYCNDLVYQGVLEPLRGEPKQEVPWGSMTLVPVNAPSKSQGGSRANHGEARRIAEWLQEEKERIVAYARAADSRLMEINDCEVLQKAVGIVTPFKQQAALIRQQLRQIGITGLTVGTVHSLQGDERLLVLFSSVYGNNDGHRGKFYDRGHNMLNVAVSRAKDAFIVFGHPRVFGSDNPAAPSGLLRTRLVVGAGAS